jgi:hypothetical protein
MKTICIILLITFLNGASESPKCKTEAVIIGYDNSRCGTCGGWIINIEDQQYLVKNKLPGWEILPHRTYQPTEVAINGKIYKIPLKLRIDYTVIQDRPKGIRIDCIEIIE